ncbi:hypothetical protein [Rhodococcus sp. 06-418-5]|uniref:hypothetical protein n=1 Tax=Rhodococcus sp. 06-418-5 TaxID=2022507 RepID=UPI00117A040A|nr:hypothetical protein [Rhodococcus sp. 06-418-5]
MSAGNLAIFILIAFFRCGEFDPKAKTAAEWDYEHSTRNVGVLKPRLLQDWMVCPACIRFRFSPIHLFHRHVTGLCDGKNMR